MTTESQDALKLAYAAAILQCEVTHPPEQVHFAAALRVIPNDNGEALRVARFWPLDPIVTAEIRRLRDSGADIAALPSKADLARKAWALMNDPLTQGKDRIAAMRLYAELMGHLKTAGSGGFGDGEIGEGATGMPVAPTYTLI